MTSCPAGFQRGISSTCHVECPDDFRYLQSPEGDKCVYRYDNRRTVQLTSLPQGAQPGETLYQDELNRFNGELATVRTQIQEDEATKRTLDEANAKRTQWASEYSRIQGDYANYSSATDVNNKLNETSSLLRPIRAKTAPGEDLEKERRAISFELRQNMLLVQFSLFLLVVSLISYLVLPRDWAHGITFLLLCVGIATGFFLRR